MLPTIDHPITILTIPSTKTTLQFRPFLVKEEKLLLMAKESGTPADTLVAIKQIVKNCCLDVNFDINKLTIFDLEYLFLKLRAISVDNICKVSYRDEEDKKIYDFEIDLNTIEVSFPKDINNIIKITDKMGIILKYPSASLYDDKTFINIEKDYLFELIVRCVDKIYNGDDIYESKSYKTEEISRFLDELDSKTFTACQNFLLNIPSIKYNISYKNTLGNERNILLSSLNDFFTLR